MPQRTDTRPNKEGPPPPDDTLTLTEPYLFHDELVAEIHRLETQVEHLTEDFRRAARGARFVTVAAVVHLKRFGSVEDLEWLLELAQREMADPEGRS